ncbi:MAG: hypothetical protein U9Q77_06315 [Candidatus Marinimicrobia bacterium]|nr:hypothetical protein [Candidatus Neomarinimicrobiota bacterium]
MRKKNAYLSGINRLTNVQARAICESNERYEKKHLHYTSDTDRMVMDAIDKIRNAIHEGRYVPLCGANRLTADEVLFLIRRIRSILNLVSYATGFEKRSLKKALIILDNSRTKSRIYLRGKLNRLYTLWSGGDDGEYEDDFPINASDMLSSESYSKQPGAVIDVSDDPDPF